MSPRRLFGFVTDINLEDKDVENYIAKVGELTEQELSNEDQIVNGVFEKSFIPQTTFLHPATRRKEQRYDGDNNNTESDDTEEEDDNTEEEELGD